MAHATLQRIITMYLTVRTILIKIITTTTITKQKTTLISATILQIKSSSHHKFITIIQIMQLYQIQSSIQATITHLAEDIKLQLNQLTIHPAEEQRQLTIHPAEQLTLPVAEAGIPPVVEQPAVVVEQRVVAVEEPAVAEAVVAVAEGADVRKLYSH
jgi:hypothetical protein